MLHIEDFRGFTVIHDLSSLVPCKSPYANSILSLDGTTKILTKQTLILCSSFLLILFAFLLGFLGEPFEHERLQGLVNVD